MAKWAKLCTLVAISFTFACILRSVCGRDDDNQEPSNHIETTLSTIEAASTSNENLYSDQVSGKGYPGGHLLRGGVENEDSGTEGTKPNLIPKSHESNPLSRNLSQKSPLLLVSTLDGMISALDADNEGSVLWQIETGPGSLLSSSISKVELSSNGKFVRLIPSLDGGLYQFDGESIEPIPISADSLLHSSFRAADDLIITGGKEVRTYGLDARTGRLQYLCTAGGCHVEPAEAGSSGEFLIVRRHSQVIRAIEPRTGAERWNFSVGRHEASLLHAEAETFAHCQTNNDPEDPMDCLLESKKDETLPSEPVSFKEASRMEFKVVVPDGVVCAVQPQRTSNLLWKYKFESPIVQVWQLMDGHLVPMDLFSANYLPALEEKREYNGETQALSSALLYVGIHNHQLYVQESSRMSDRVASISSQPANDVSRKLSNYAAATLELEWKPIEATTLVVSNTDGKPGRFTISPPSNDGSNESEGERERKTSSDHKVTALIVRHQTEFPFDRGFYLFESKRKENPSKSFVNTEENGDKFHDDEELWEGGRDTPVHIVIVSLWFWWREVVFISLVTAFSFHMIITRQVVFLLQRRWAVELQRHLGTMVPFIAARLAAIEVERGQGQDPGVVVNANDKEDPQRGVEVAMDSVVVQSSETLYISPPSPPSPPSYVSRYLTDFEPIQCLGRGGFGLVFEVRNRLDDCHYAVKRIQLPRTEEAREKVMREVKALAKLDNPHIVRYFHAWIECPPPGWQEAQDAAWLDSENLTGPTPFNSGDEGAEFRVDSTSSEESECEHFRVSRALKSLDAISRRRKFLTDDSSFDVVFEDSGKQNHHSLSADSTQDDDECCRVGISADSDLSVNSASNDSSHKRKSIKQSTRNSTNPTQEMSRYMVPDAKMYLFIQMQLCRKESLREWLRSHVSHRDTYQVVHMFNEIVRAVEYVHLQGLIHRDLKPSNIFFAPDGAIKIGDFGLVTAMAEEAYYQSPMSPDASYGGTGYSPYQRTHTDQVGTQMYMSPEQIEGKPYNYKVDIYSLGLIFVELLWPLTTQMEQVTVISQLRKLKLPEGFADKYPNESVLLLKMLSKNPDERPTTYGIRASPTLVSHQDPTIFDIPEYLYFNLSRPRSTTRSSSTSSS